MITKKIKLISLLSLSAIISSVHAESFYVSHHEQYISINAGMAYADTFYQDGRNKHGFRGTGTSLFLGDQINHIFGPELEFQYDDYSSVRSYLLGGADFRVTFNYNRYLNVFAKIGLGGGEVRTCNQGSCLTKNNVVPLFGAGVGLYVARHWLTSLEFNGSYYPNDPQMNVKGVLGVATIGVTRFFNA